MNFSAIKKRIWHSARIYILHHRIRNAEPTLRIVLGAGGTFHKGWIHTDIDTLDITSQSNWGSHFVRDSISALLAEHVWEHLTGDEAQKALQNCFSYLRPGGYLRLAVPDGFNPSESYIEYVKVGGSGAGADDHKILYNYLSLGKALGLAGFRINLLEYFDEAGKFHQNEWDPEAGRIERSQKFDPRNTAEQLNYTSLIVDAIKETSNDGV